MRSALICDRSITIQRHVTYTYKHVRFIRIVFAESGKPKLLTCSNYFKKCWRVILLSTIKQDIMVQENDWKDLKWVLWSIIMSTGVLYMRRIVLSYQLYKKHNIFFQLNFLSLLSVWFWICFSLFVRIFFCR